MAENYTMAPSSGPPLNGGGVRRISRSGMKIKVGTWNVRSLFEAGKTANVIMEMTRLGVGLLGISEMRWPNSGSCLVEKHMVYYSGEDSNHHRNGVGFVVSNDLSKSITDFVPVSDRVALLRINAIPMDINVIQVYAPTTNATDQQVEEFYADLNTVLRQTKKNEMVIVMGDFNAKVGKGNDGKMVGSYGLGERNDRGDRLVQFCQEEELILANTFFQLPPRRLYTWKSPADTSEHRVRNQIDFIAINERFKNSIKAARTYPGADVPSDHNLLVAVIRFRPKKLIKKKRDTAIDIRKLNDACVQQEARQLLEEKLETIRKVDPEGQEELWIHFRQAVTDVANEKLKKTITESRKAWMTEEILLKMGKRRQYKNSNIQKYKDLQREIRRDIRAAKERKLAEVCSEIEALEAKHDSFGVHKKIKETSGIYRSRQAQFLVDSQGQIQMDVAGKLRVWKEYIEKLFHDTRPQNYELPEAVSGPSITKAEVEKALARMKSGKAAGPDAVQIEIIKLINEDHMDILVTLLNDIYETGNIPSDWLVSTFITIPKKGRTKKCEDYRTISLMSHVLKLFLKIIHERLYRKLEENIGDTQFGFRSGFGTREALFTLQVLIQRCRDVNKDVYACFIDLEKAFDKIKHEKMMTILQTTGVDDKDIRIIANLYWRQKAAVRVENQLTPEIEILRGVRQGCVLSPLLFNLYSEKLFQETIYDCEDGVSVNGITINNIRYADDTVLLADTSEGLQNLLDRIMDAGE